MIRKFITLAVLIAAPSIVLSADPVVAFSPSKARLSDNETVTVDIVMQDFPVSEGGGVSLKFNPAIIRVTGVELDTVNWNLAGKTGAIDNEAGVVADILFSNFKGVSGAATIATVEFQAIKSGKTQLKLTESSLNPFASGGSHIPVTFERSTIKVGISKGNPKKVNIQNRRID